MVLHLTNADIERSVSPADAHRALVDAFRAWGLGDAAVQQRVRTDCGASKLSTLGAVLLGGGEEGVVGAKVYATVGGKFTFLVALFSALDGRLRATLEADALTRLRTAATSVIAAEVLGPPHPRNLVVFGSGVQAQGHVEAFASHFELSSIVLVGRTPPFEAAEQLAGQVGQEVVATDDASSPLANADLVITATRSVDPLFGGSDLGDGAHVGAIGSSRPESRELDGSVYERASRIGVEWKVQARAEAGGLIQATESGAIQWDDVVELADLVTGAVPGRSDDDAVTVFQAVGIGLEDVAVAALAVNAATS